VWMPIRTRSSPPSGHSRAARGRLRLGRGQHGILGTAEGHEEGVALGVDLLAAVGDERLAQDPLVLREHVAVFLAQPLEQSGRALDVGERAG